MEGWILIFIVLVIINHKYKFIFIKSFKTAGTSLEIALSKFCDEKDIITPIVEEDENIRRSLNYLGPQNFGQMREHMTAVEIKKKIPSNIFKNYLKFVVVRNPFDQIISSFYWHNESKKKEKKFLFFKKKKLSFNDFFDRKAKNIFEDELNRYLENGKIIVDKFVKYENLEENLNEISSKLKLPENLYEIFKNIKAKSNISPPKEKRIRLNKEHIKKIKILAEKILKLHSYNF